MRRWATLCLLLAGCSTGQGHAALNRMTDIADPTYQLAVDTCNGLRDLIVARADTSYDEDRADMDEVNLICDSIVEGFESLASGQQTARGALNSGLQGAAAALVQRALDQWPHLQDLVRRLMQLRDNQTSGGDDG